MKLLSLVLNCALLVAPGQVTAQVAADSTASLAPGDIVHIEVWRQPTFSGDFLIAPDGSISHPLYHEINVVGVPLSTVESRIRQFLMRYEATPQFVIVPRMHLVVGGEVRNPSVLTVPFGTRVVQALALAGGFTDRSDMKRVMLVREGVVETLDLTDPASVASRVPVRSGDQLLVDRSRSFFRDVITPASSVVAALGAIVSIIISLKR